MNKYISIFSFIFFIAVIFSCSDSNDNSSTGNSIVFTNISPSEDSTIQTNDSITVEGTYNYNEFSDSQTYLIRLLIKVDTSGLYDIIDSDNITSSSGSFQLSGTFDLTSIAVHPYEVIVKILQQIGTNSYTTKVNSEIINYQ